MTTNRTDPILKLSATEVQLVQDWRELDAEIKKMTRERDAIVQRFKEHMEATGARICIHRRRTLVEMGETRRNILDAKRLREEKPEIAREYTKESVSHKPHYVSDVA